MRGPLTQRRRRALLWILWLVPAGMLCRFAPLHLPFFVFKYGGSAAWAATVYWLTVLARPHWRPWSAALLGAALAFAVEWGKKIYWPPLDRFRESLAGKLLLGRHFTFGALIAYLAAIALSLAADRVQDNLQLRGGPKSGKT